MPAIGGAATRLIGGRPFESQPRFLPDGAQLVYISDRDGADNVWIANSNGTGPRQLSHERLATMFSPRWLSDGKAIVVSATDRDGVVELWRFDLDGGTPPKLGQRTRNTPSLLVSASYPGAYGAEPSPDGRLLYYTMVEPRQHRAVEGPRAFITRLDLATGNERWLKFPFQRDELEARVSRDLLPNYAFTPDGTAILAAFGGKIHRLTMATGADLVVPFSADVALESAERLAFPGRVAEGPVRARILQRPAFSPDGRHLVFSAFAGLYLVDLPNGRPRRLTPTPGAREFEPAWSPDGKWIAFVTWTAAAGGSIWRVRADGSNSPERLTSVAAFYTRPAWSPDRAALVALRASRQSRLGTTGPMPGPPPDADLISLPATGGSVKRIMAAQGMTLPHFSADPARIYATASGEGLVSVTLDGSDRRAHVQVVEGLRTGPPVPAVLPTPWWAAERP